MFYRHSSSKVRNFKHLNPVSMHSIESTKPQCFKIKKLFDLRQLFIILLHASLLNLLMRWFNCYAKCFTTDCCFHRNLCSTNLLDPFLEQTFGSFASDLAKFKPILKDLSISIFERVVHKLISFSIYFRIMGFKCGTLVLHLFSPQHF